MCPEKCKKKQSYNLELMIINEPFSNRFPFLTCLSDCWTLARPLEDDRGEETGKSFGWLKDWVDSSLLRHNQQEWTFQLTLSSCCWRCLSEEAARTSQGVNTILYNFIFLTLLVPCDIFKNHTLNAWINFKTPTLQTSSKHDSKY